jgi:hypothetical protein
MAEAFFADATYDQASMRNFARFRNFIAVLFILAQPGISWAAEMVVVRGEAIIQGGEQATDAQLGNARIDAIIDAVRSVAMQKKTRVISHSLVESNGQLFENVFVDSEMPIREIDIVNENRLGGIYQVELRVALENGEPQGDVGCTTLKKPYKREVIFQTTGLTEHDAYGSLDAFELVQRSKVTLGAKIKNSAHMLYKPSGSVGGSGTGVYASSALPVRQFGNQYTIHVEIEKSSEMLPDTLSSISAIFGNKSSFLLSVALPTGQIFKKTFTVSGNNPAKLQNIHSTAEHVDVWIDSIWPSIESTFQCLPSKTILEDVQDSRRLNLGIEHGVREGQMILLIDQDGGRMRMSPMHDASYQLYRVAHAAENFSRLERLSTTKYQQRSGPKIAIQF